MSPNMAAPRQRNEDVMLFEMQPLVRFEWRGREAYSGGMLLTCHICAPAHAVPAQCRKGAKKDDDVPRDRTQICQNDKKGEDEVQVYNITMRSPTFSRWVSRARPCLHCLDRLQ